MKTPIPIILVRHGQTAWNNERRFRGRSDVPLDDFGIKQSEAAAVKLADCGATAIYSSPLQRTMMTSDSIAGKLGLITQPFDGLVDIEYGDWQGFSTKEALEENAELYNQWIETPQNVGFPNGECLQDVRDRLDGVLTQILTAHAEQTVILVSHVVVCRVFICMILGLDDSHFWQIGQDVNAINMIGIRDGNLVLNSLNDTCHLKGLNQV